ncbi:MAG: hypothetical protein AB7V58_01415 [Solirubrobacterales bacterium]
MAARHSEQHPQDPPADEQEGNGKTRRERIVQFGFGAAFVALIIGIVLLMLNAELGSSEEQEGAFGQHYNGLQERRIAAGVPTMGDARSGDHLHPQLALYARGKEIVVPVNIGIDPDLPHSEMAGLHTHDEEGTIHVENAAGSTLGQFFEIWGVPLAQGRLGPYRANRESAVRMWVDGRPSRAFGALKLADPQEIVIAYGPHGAPPPPLDAG